MKKLMPWIGFVLIALQPPVHAALPESLTFHPQAALQMQIQDLMQVEKQKKKLLEMQVQKEVPSFSHTPQVRHFLHVSD
jgi:hypothetical protein